MKQDSIYVELFGWGSTNTFYNWQKEEEKRKILKLLKKYFKLQEIEEFLQTGKIQKYDFVKNFSQEEIEQLIVNAQRNHIEEQIMIKMKEIQELQFQLTNNKKGLKWQ